MSLATMSVGVDHSEPAQAALRWAAGLAGSTGAELRAINVWHIPLVGAMSVPLDGMTMPQLREDQARAALAKAVADAGITIDVDEQVLEGSAGPVLVAEAFSADLLVVGRTGHGDRHGVARLAEIALGSTARHCVHHARVPVATIPKGSRWSEPATAVVGLDGSPASFTALAWALTNLPATTEVHAVRAYAPWVGDGLYPADLVDNDAVHESVQRETQGWVDAIVADIGPAVVTAPAVEIDIGSARDVLVERDYPVDLVVVGERGRTAVAAMVLGSISDHMVRYAACPVVVVPDDLPHP